MLWRKEEVGEINKGPGVIRRMIGYVYVNTMKKDTFTCLNKKSS